MRHKHADVLIAIAEGKEVQFKYNDSWQDRKFLNPLDNDSIDLEWRIKPEQKPDVVMCVKVAKHSGTHYIGTGNAYIDYKKMDCCNLKITFDGETNKLKSAEVINEN